MSSISATLLFSRLTLPQRGKDLESVCFPVVRDHFPPHPTPHPPQPHTPTQTSSEERFRLLLLSDTYSRQPIFCVQSLKTSVYFQPCYTADVTKCCKAVTPGTFGSDAYQDRKRRLAVLCPVQIQIPCVCGSQSKALVLSDEQRYSFTQASRVSRLSTPSPQTVKEKALC